LTQALDATRKLGIGQDAEECADRERNPAQKRWIPVGHSSIPLLIEGPDEFTATAAHKRPRARDGFSIVRSAKRMKGGRAPFQGSPSSE
jgi:hypothetical protein